MNKPEWLQGKSNPDYSYNIIAEWLQNCPDYKCRISHDELERLPKLIYAVMEFVDSAARATAFESAIEIANLDSSLDWAGGSTGNAKGTAMKIAALIAALATRQPGAAQGESDEQVGQVSTQQYADDFALMLLCRTSSEHVNGTHRIYNSDARDAADYLSERGFVEVKGDIFRWTDKFLEHVAGRSTVARLVGGRGDDEND